MQALTARLAASTSCSWLAAQLSACDTAGKQYQGGMLTGLNASGAMHSSPGLTSAAESPVAPAFYFRPPVAATAAAAARVAAAAPLDVAAAAAPADASLPVRAASGL